MKNNNGAIKTLSAGEVKDSENVLHDQRQHTEEEKVARSRYYSKWQRQRALTAVQWEHVSTTMSCKRGSKCNSRKCVICLTCGAHCSCLDMNE